MRLEEQRPSAAYRNELACCRLCQREEDGRGTKRVKRWNEFGGVRLRWLLNRPSVTEMWQRRNSQYPELKRQKFLRILLVLNGNRYEIVPLVHPHTGGRGLGDVGIVEIVREL